MVLKWVCPKPHGASSCLHTNTTPSLRAKNKKQKGEIDVKKIISIALALLMVAVMLPVMAMAAEVTTAEDLKAAVAAGGEVTLGDDITASITVKNGKPVTLNLNGHKLTNDADKDTIYVEMGGTLIINGTGTVDNVSHVCAAIFNNGTVTLNGGTYTRSAEKGTGKTGEDNANGNSWYTICNHGIMTVNPGVTVTNTGTFSSMFENGYQSYTGSKERQNYVEGTNNAAPALTINGGTFEGGKITIKNDDGGILKIGGGRFTNNGNRVVFNANKAEINGGEFYCPATYFGNEIAVDTLYADGGQNAGQLTITGGTFDGKVTQSNGAVTTVSGGTFKKGVDESYIVDGKKLDANGNVVPETITIIVPSDGGNTTTTPSTDNTKNPSTGANDLVGVAAAMAVVSLLGAAAVIRKK
mgnify:CR=1 FL=1